MIADSWFGCYGGSLKDWIVPQAMSHPAKFSRKLISRMYAHALEEQWLTPGDLVLDPLCGVALGGTAAVHAGMRWLGVELEPSWAELGRACLEKHRKTWEWMGRSMPEIIQGDARFLLDLLASRGPMAGVVSSPPYVGGGHHPDQTGSWGGLQAEKAIGLGTEEAASYGQTHGQIGRMPEGEISAVITSPPYNLPFSQDHPGTHGGKRGRDRDTEPGRFVRYGDTTGQIEGLPSGDVNAIITSPPYGAASNIAGKPGKPGKPTWKAGGIRNRDPRLGQGYGEHPDQIGDLTHHTYWATMARIYEQCHTLLAPGGHIILVLKPFVRHKAIVDLPGQTCQLLEAVGFRLLHRHRAWLISKEAQRRFDGSEARREYKSFFRRLQERKGSPRIDFEEVICAEKSAASAT